MDDSAGALSRRSIRDALPLACAGALLVAIFVAHAICFGRHRSVDAYYLNDALMKLRVFAALFTVFLVPLWYASRSASRVPPATALGIVLVVFAAISLIAIVTGPTRSQDLNLNLLLAKGFAHLGLNPYRTEPGSLAQDLWAPPDIPWSRQPMTHGPIWTLLIGLIAACTYSLAVAMALVKLVAAGALAVGWLLLWKIMRLHGVAPEERAGRLMLLAWNPFVLQTALVDAHNDVLILVAILASCLLFLRGHYARSALALLIGGFVKYALWPLSIVPLARLVKERGVWPGGRSILLLSAAWGLLALVLCAPFGFSVANLAGYTDEVLRHGWTAFYWPGAALLGSIPGMGVPQVRLAGFILALLVLVLCLRAGRALRGYTLPLAAMLFFGTPSFHPWYALWIAPLATLVVPPAVLLIASVPLIADELAPRRALWIVTFGMLALLGAARALQRRRAAARH